MCVTPVGFCLTPPLCLSIDRWANVKVECDPSWQPFQGHCYRLQAEKRSWQESKRACLRGGGDLLSIHSMTELEFITKQIKQGEGLHVSSLPAREAQSPLFPSLLVFSPSLPTLLYPRGGRAMDWPQ